MLIIFLFLTNQVAIAEKYTIDGTFDGCEHGKLYGLVGAGVLECREYNYFYEYRPEVITDGREVVVIGDEQVEGYIYNGSVIETKVNGEFEGCDFDKKYMFTNGLVFDCMSFSYSYSFMPEVRIIHIDGRAPVIYIDGKKYDGILY